MDEDEKKKQLALTSRHHHQEHVNNKDTAISSERNISDELAGVYTTVLDIYNCNEVLLSRQINGLELHNFYDNSQVYFVKRIVKTRRRNHLK